MCKFKVKWLYVIEKDYSWQSGLAISENAEFYDKSGVKRLDIKQSGEINVLKDYAWDGCTPKFCLLDVVFGVPDGVVHERTKRPKTYYASLVHDALYQFLDDDLPLSRKDADDCFLKLMQESDFALSKLYYWAVRCFGHLFRRIAKKVRKTQGKKLTIAGS